MEMQKAELIELLERQRAAQLHEGPPSAALRRDRIDRLLDVVLANSTAFTEALRLDFGHRSPFQSLLSEVLGVVAALKSDRKNLEDWMKPRRAGGRLSALVMGNARVEVSAARRRRHYRPVEFPAYPGRAAAIAGFCGRQPRDAEVF